MALGLNVGCGRIRSGSSRTSRVSPSPGEDEKNTCPFLSRASCLGQGPGTAHTWLKNCWFWVPGASLQSQEPEKAENLLPLSFRNCGLNSVLLSYQGHQLGAP